MTPKQAFQIGFLRRCLADGLTPDQAGQRAEKLAAVITAFAAQAQPVKQAGLTDLPGKALELGAGWGIPLALVAPFAAGGAVGYGVGRLSDIGEADVEEVKEQELIDEYRRQAAIARQAATARDASKRLATRRSLLRGV